MNAVVVLSVNFVTIPPTSLHHKQSQVRAIRRLREGRPKVIDHIARYLFILDEVPGDLLDPTTVFDGLPLEDANELYDEIRCVQPCGFCFVLGVLLAFRLRRLSSAVFCCIRIMDVDKTVALENDHNYTHAPPTELCSHVRSSRRSFYRYVDRHDPLHCPLSPTMHF